MILLCKIFGHKWKTFIITEYKKEWVNKLENGLGIPSYNLENVPYDHYREEMFCLRCGFLNSKDKDSYDKMVKDGLITN